MATISSDKIQVYFDLGVDGAMQNISRISNSFQKLKQIVDNTRSLKRTKDELHSLGLTSTKTGQYVDILTGKFVSLENVMKRIQAGPSTGLGLEKLGGQSGGMNAQSLLNDSAVKQQGPDLQQLLSGLQGEIGASYGQIQGIAQQLSAAAMSGADISTQFRYMNTLLKDSPEQLEVFNAQLRQSYSMAKQMQMMGPMFGFLFGGMQMSIWGKSIMRFVLPAMDKVNGYVSEGTKRVNAMKASFEFLKFSMFEMVTSSWVFKVVLESIINITNWVSKLVSQNGFVQALVLGFAGLAAVFVGGGILGQIAGGYYQGMMLWTALFGKPKVSEIVADTNKVTSAFEKLGGVVNKIGLGGSIALSLAGLTSFALDLSKEDFASAVGSGIATALGLGASAAFLLGAGPLGWTLLISGAIVLGVTKITADKRSITNAARRVAGLEELNPFESFFKSITQGQDEGWISAKAQQAAYQYSQMLNEVSSIENNLASSSNNEDKIFWNKVLLDSQKELSQAKNDLLLLDKENGATIIADLEYQKSLYQDNSSEITTASNAYTPLISNIAQSKIETDLFNKNIELMTTALTSSNMLLSIMNIKAIDDLWVQANTHLSEFATALDEWAAKTVTKTVKIKYEEENKPKETNGFFGTVGDTVDRVFSSSIRG